MENIVIIEKLCEELQKSERPADLNAAIVLRVVLDENILIDEQRERATVNFREKIKENAALTRDKFKLEVQLQQLKAINIVQEKEVAVLKTLNDELSTSLEISKKLLDLHRFGSTGKLILVDSSLGEPKVKIVNPTQGKIDFPDTRAALTATPVNTREKSVYYKMAEWRAKRIYAFYCKDPDWFMLSTNHIVPWINKFFLKPGEKLTLSHIEFACLPKCYAGLGITTGIQLYNLLITTKK